MRTLTLIVTVGLTTLSCVIKERRDGISGIYVREYSSEVINVESGDKIGMRMVRDSIFIRPIEDGYEVFNRKWRKNDYDQEEWQSMEHSDDRPLPAFTAIYDSKMNMLVSESNSRFLYLSEGRLYIDKELKRPYVKIRV